VMNSSGKGMAVTSWLNVLNDIAASNVTAQVKAFVVILLLIPIRIHTYGAHWLYNTSA
jgi:hypothetical protein